MSLYSVMLMILSALLALQSVPLVPPALFTDAVADDADDPAIWVNAKSPKRSMIYGTNKIKAPGGAIAVFDLKGKLQQTIANVDRPNNIDVEYGLVTPTGTIDIAVATERNAHRLRVFAIHPKTGLLSDISGDTTVLAGLNGEASEPMGIGLYRRHRDRAIFAIVSPKTGRLTNYLHQYRLTFNPTTGKVDAAPVRSFGAYSAKKEIESVAVDDELGFVYYSDERFGTRRYYADPKAGNQELALFNQEGFEADHEGIALWTRPGGKGYLICTDQIAGDSIYHLYDRRTLIPLGKFRGEVDETDGLDATSADLGRDFPQGLVIAMNSKGRNFAVWDWRKIAKTLRK
jgi:3-phytase